MIILSKKRIAIVLGCVLVGIFTFMLQSSRIPEIETIETLRNFNVNATSAVIAGAVNGDIDVHGPVIVDSTAVIMGNIKSRSVQINNGAVIEGFCSQSYSDIDVKSFFA